MIKKVELTNFYGFGNTTIELHPEVNILIGINGSGKSNFLKALRLLKEGATGIGLKKYLFDYLGGFDGVFNRTVLPSGLPSSRNIELEYTFDTKKFKYQNEYDFKDNHLVYKIILARDNSQNYYVEESLWRSDGYEYFNSINGFAKGFERDGKGVNKHYFYNEGFDGQELMLNSIVLRNEEDFHALTVLKKNIREIVVYDFDTSPNSGIRRMVSSNSTKALSSDGGNLTQLLNMINVRDKKNFRKIEEMLKEVNPYFTGMDFHFIGGNIELQLEERELTSSIPISNISDGTLRYLCLLAIFFNSNRGNLVCIDEPELGLHPDMILNVANTIKELSPETLFIISTHSENFLNYFEVENLKIFEKTDKNQTIIKSFSTEQFAEWYEDYTIGQMWKQGDFGGVRYGN